MREKLRELPSVNELLQHSKLQPAFESFNYEWVKEQVQEEIDNTRSSILAGNDVSVVDDEMIERVLENLARLSQSSLRAVINGTGTILHTNLGRALLSEPAVDAMVNVAKQYNNLEYSIEEGQRGTRYEHIESIISQLTGAESALLVNNNAAAVMLILTTFTQGKEVLISRGELVEIGGSFRIPDVITSGGAKLREVGSTNKTHIRDYQVGINEETGAIIRVHTSNYRVVGFTDKVSDQELVDLAQQHDIPVFNDLGSGLLVDLQEYGLSYEPTVEEMIQVGYDLVSFSGDKLLGGPQAGIIAGKKKYIDQLKKHPLLRALRSDKFTIAALEATLMSYFNLDKALEEIPTLKMITVTQEDLKVKADKLAELINNSKGFDATVEKGTSQIGGGSYPEEHIPTFLVSVSHEICNEAQLEYGLRLGETPIICRIKEGKIQFDVRTIKEEDFQVIVKSLEQTIQL